MSDGDKTRAALLRASKPPTTELFATLITANHILHQQNVVDAYGHISVRNPQDPSTFFISRNVAPALVSGRDDIVEYRVADASPVKDDAPKGYLERFIHSELYKKYKDVQSVVHSHSEAVIPFSISSVPLRPVLHMGSAVGSQVPVFDIALHRPPDNSMLVSNEATGAALASGFNPSTVLSKTTNLVKSFVTSVASEAPAWPSCPVVLMRGHGFTCVGAGIEEAVYRAVYTCTNARIQTTASLMQGSFNVGLVGERFGAGEKETGPAKTESIKFLSDKECRDASEKMKGTVERPWELWSAQVDVSPLYHNELAEEDT